MKIKLLLLLIVGTTAGCASLETKSTDYIVIKALATNSAPTVILAHGCDGFTHSNGLSYRRRAHVIAYSFKYNVILYDAFKPRGWQADEVCTGARGANANAVPPVWRVEDTKQIARWIQQQPWHQGKISFIGYSHGGSVALALANDAEASKLISSAVAYYPNCDESYIGKRINKPLIPTLVHLGEADNWTPIHACLQYKSQANFEMHTYKDATHAWEDGFTGTAIGKWPIKYNFDAAQQASNKTKEFFDRTLK